MDTHGCERERERETRAPGNPNKIDEDAPRDVEKLLYVPSHSVFHLETWYLGHIYIYVQMRPSYCKSKYSPPSTLRAQSTAVSWPRSKTPARRRATRLRFPGLLIAMTWWRSGSADATPSRNSSAALSRPSSRTAIPASKTCAIGTSRRRT